MNIPSRAQAPKLFQSNAIVLLRLVGRNARCKLAVIVLLLLVLVVIISRAAVATIAANLIANAT